MRHLSSTKRESHHVNELRNWNWVSSWIRFRGTENTWVKLIWQRMLRGCYFNLNYITFCQFDNVFLNWWRSWHGWNSSARTKHMCSLLILSYVQFLTHEDIYVLSWISFVFKAFLSLVTAVLYTVNAYMPKIMAWGYEGHYMRPKTSKILEREDEVCKY